MITIADYLCRCELLIGLQELPEPFVFGDDIGLESAEGAWRPLGPRRRNDLVYTKPTWAPRLEPGKKMPR